MENKYQQLSSLIQEHRNIGQIDQPTVHYSDGANSLYLSIDTQESIYQCRYQAEDIHLKSSLEILSQISNDKKVESIYNFTISQLATYFESDKEVINFISKNKVSLEKALAMFRKASAIYWGYLAYDQVDDLVCRCNSIGKKAIDQAYKETGDAKKVFQKLNLAGVCGTCKSDANKILSEFELREKTLYGENKDIWAKKIDEIINEFFMLCPPEFSSLKFEFISITPRVIKLKCIREGDKPTRVEIQDSLNNFFKGQLDPEIPISIVI